MIVVYEQRETSFNSFGLGILDEVISCTVVEEINSRYEVEIEYKITEKSEEIIIENNILKVQVKDKDPQLFRIKHIDKGIAQGYILGFHISYDLNNNFIEDSFVRNKTANESLNKILTDTNFTHNFQGISQETNISSARYVRKNVLEAIFSADNSFVNRWGGFILRDNFKLRHKQKGQTFESLIIESGKNLTSINFKIDISELATRIMPQGTETLLLPEKYIDSENINLYPTPIIKHIQYDDIGIKEDEEDFITYDEACEMLRERVQEEYASGIDKPILTVEIDFVELSKTVEYKEEGYENLEKVMVGDIVKVRVPHLNLDKDLQVIELTYNSLMQKIETITLGETTSSYFNKSRNSLMSEISNIVSTEIPSSITQARIRISEEIKEAMGGYVYKTNSELYIMDAPEVDQAVKIWRWNLNGLAYTNQGIDGEYQTAITSDR